MSKLEYLTRSLIKRLSCRGSKCPSCGAGKSDLISSKYFVTELRRCSYCKLLYRVPVDSVNESKRFYQSSYKQGITTEMPDPDELARLKDTVFVGTEKDYAGIISIVEAFGVTRGARIFDFGCSWGYGSWQFMQHGYEVESYEISIPRAHYAEDKLSCHVYQDLDDVLKNRKFYYDVFFSSHVLEHVPSVRRIIDLAARVLKNDGLFLAFTPNGSESFRKKAPRQWQRLWGQVHPNFLDDQYYIHQFGDFPYLLASEPYDLDPVRNWSCSGNKQRLLDLSGSELLCAAKLNGLEPDVR